MLWHSFRKWSTLVNFFPASYVPFSHSTYGKRNINRLVQYLVVMSRKEESTVFQPLIHHQTVCLPLYLVGSKIVKYWSIVFCSGLPFSINRWNFSSRSRWIPNTCSHQPVPRKQILNRTTPPPQKNHNKQHNSFQYIVLYNPKYFNSIHFLWKYIQRHREEGQEVLNILRIALRAENMTRNELENSRYFSSLFCCINVSLWRYSLYICVFTVKCMFKYFAMLGLHFLKLQVGLWRILKLFFNFHIPWWPPKMTHSEVFWPGQEEAGLAAHCLSQLGM